VTPWDDPDRHLSALNRRARLLRECAGALLDTNRPTLAALLMHEAFNVAEEAVAHITDIGSGARHGEAYYHEGDMLLIGWALADGEVATS
jgi:hypothetical protein